MRLQGRLSSNQELSVQELIDLIPRNELYVKRNGSIMYLEAAGDILKVKGSVFAKYCLLRFGFVKGITKGKRSGKPYIIFMS